MGTLLRFILDALRHSIGGSIASGVLLAMGVNIQQIASAIWKHPPEFLTHWATPWVFTILAVILIAEVFRRQVTWLNDTGPSADLLAFDAIDYIVNDSTMCFPPSRHERDDGSFEYIDGLEHDEARKALNAALNNGSLNIWGRRDRYAQLNGPYIYEDASRPIPKEYWSSAELDILGVLYDLKNGPQTAATDRNHPVQTYTELMFNRDQIQKNGQEKASGDV